MVFEKLTLASWKKCDVKTVKSCVFGISSWRWELHASSGNNLLSNCNIDMSSPEQSHTQCPWGNIRLVLTLIFWVWKYQVWSHVSHGVKFSHENIRFGWHLSHVRCQRRENIRARSHFVPWTLSPGGFEASWKGKKLGSDCMRPEERRGCGSWWEHSAKYVNISEVNPSTDNARE